ncbi:MAG: endonuclease/exonuclease/phosphatase family protein [Clostridiales bacterium]|nr:endonuclease/exonuclease/phosphatase family protein [Clostridiales bacterium]
MNQITVFLSKAVSFLTTLILVITATVTSPLQNPPITPQEPGTVRVLTFNVRCTNVGVHFQKDRVGAVVGAIEAIAPDSFGVQEATPEWMESLKANLPDYESVGVGRRDGEGEGEFSAIFYLKDKYEAPDSGTFWLSNTPDVPSRSWTSMLNRVCTWVELKDRTTGVRFLHINTHFDTSFTPRKNSIPLILEKAAQYDIPVICTGDFNTMELSPLYTELLSGVLTNAKFDAPDTMSILTFNNQRSTKRVGRVLDHILVNSKVEAKVYRVVTDHFDGMLPSDHYPIYADVVLHS